MSIFEGLDMTTCSPLRILRAALLAACLGAGLAAALPAAAQTAACGPVVTADTPPPPLPDYEQPPIPAPGYIWSPGYWSWGDDEGDYYWVPGTWALPPRPGLLWTPGYWAWVGGQYLFHEGYWGPHVGFYGGVAYGFGYTGEGYEGGRWDHGVFFYNTAVNNNQRPYRERLQQDRGHQQRNDQSELQRRQGRDDRETDPRAEDLFAGRPLRSDLCAAAARRGRCEGSQTLRKGQPRRAADRCDG